MDDAQLDFVNSFDAMSETVHRVSQEKGWWETDRSDGELIVLCHSELSEAFEALREDKNSSKIEGFKGVEEELADVIIRIMDMAEKRKLNVSEAIIEKIEYNATRSYKHRGKKF